MQGHPQPSSVEFSAGGLEEESAKVRDEVAPVDVSVSGRWAGTLRCGLVLG